MSPTTPEAVLDRQFGNLAVTRRHIYSLLPLRDAGSIVEPGCGTGLLARELLPLTDAGITCIDKVRRPGVPPGVRFILGDAAKNIPEARIYISSFFLYQLPSPEAYLRKVRRALGQHGFYAVAGEFAYHRRHPLAAALSDSLSGQGFDPCFGARAGRVFAAAGYRTVESGMVAPLREEPQRELLAMQLGAKAPRDPESLCVPVFWGVFSAR